MDETESELVGKNLGQAQQRSSAQRNVSVCAVTVTYGDRLAKVQPVIARLESMRSAGSPLNEIIVVDNGSADATRNYLRELAIAGRVSVISIGYNAGSAAGFTAGLEAAVKSNCNHAWLLDDDNLPEPDALMAILTQVEKSSSPAAYLSLRIDREEYSRFASTRSPVDAFEWPDSFLGFAWQRTFTKVPRSPQQFTARSTCTVPIPYGPYGGLFLPTELIPVIGLPRTDYHLYGDDHEFTYRLSRLQIPLLLVPSSRVQDLESSWNMGKKKEVREKEFFISPLVLLSSDPNLRRRLYYSVRNRVHFESHFRVANRFCYLFNASVKLLVVYSLALLACGLRLDLTPLRNTAILAQAVRDGLESRLGKTGR
ncbi:MAG TPA: glycosyltransferase [Trueperaceae bacterium]